MEPIPRQKAWYSLFCTTLTPWCSPFKGKGKVTPRTLHLVNRGWDGGWGEGWGCREAENRVVFFGGGAWGERQTWEEKEGRSMDAAKTSN
jgi:hypothetical protein